jgi:hypothetical protein
MMRGDVTQPVSAPTEVAGTFGFTDGYSLSVVRRTLCRRSHVLRGVALDPH